MRTLRWPYGPRSIGKAEFFNVSDIDLIKDLVFELAEKKIW